MRRTFTTLFWLSVALLITTPALAQESGDFRTAASGDWSNPQIWQTFNGSSWTATADPPSGAGTIWVDSTDGAPDSVWVDVAVEIEGTLVNQGIVDLEDEDSLLTVVEGGTYQHDRESGSIPTIRWADGSTLLMTGIEAEAPENRRQNYHDVVFDTPGLISNLHMDLDSVTISGDIHVRNTGIARWYLSSISVEDDPADTTAEITILGDVIVEDGAFGTQGTSNPYSQFIVNHYGNVEVTGGNFSVSRGSQPLGSTMWYLYEGDFSMANAKTQSSTQDPTAAFFVFTKDDGTQTLTLGENIDFSALPVKVETGTTLDVGTSQFGGTGFIVVEEDAEIATSLPGGIAAIFSGLDDAGGQVTLADGSSYIFNGTEAQVTSEMMPAEVTDLTIDNEAGVTLSQETTILGDLTLEAGEFDNTIEFTLGPEGAVVRNGGTLAVDPTSNEAESTIPERFFVDQNYPNPFNPSTMIEYGVPSVTEVNITVFNMLGQQVATLFEGMRPAGVHEVTFDARDMSSGVYIYRVEAGEQVVSRRMILVK